MYCDQGSDDFRSVNYPTTRSGFLVIITGYTFATQTADLEIDGCHLWSKRSEGYILRVSHLWRKIQEEAQPPSQMRDFEFVLIATSRTKNYEIK